MQMCCKEQELQMDAVQRLVIQALDLDTVKSVGKYWLVSKARHHTEAQQLAAPVLREGFEALGSVRD